MFFQDVFETTHKRKQTTETCDDGDDDDATLLIDFVRFSAAISDSRFSTCVWFHYRSSNEHKKNHPNIPDSFDSVAEAAL